MKRGILTFFFLPFLIPSSIVCCFTAESNDEEVALGVAQLAAFQVVLIFTAVAAILALTCRLRVFSTHDSARLKVDYTSQRNRSLSIKI